MQNGEKRTKKKIEEYKRRRKYTQPKKIVKIEPMKPMKNHRINKNRYKL